MITFKQALNKAREFYSPLQVSRCTELDNSWIFSFKYSNGLPAFGVDCVRVMKSNGEIFSWNTMNNYEEYQKRFLRKIEI